MIVPNDSPQFDDTAGTVNVAIPGAMEIGTVEKPMHSMNRVFRWVIRTNVPNLLVIVLALYASRPSHADVATFEAGGATIDAGAEGADAARRLLQAERTPAALSQARRRKATGGVGVPRGIAGIGCAAAVFLAGFPPDPDSLAVYVGGLAGGSSGVSDGKQPADGGNGGIIDIRAGVGDIDVGDGHDGPLRVARELSSGTYHFTDVLLTGGSMITIDGKVTIYCQFGFSAVVEGVFHPDQPPPSVQIYAGHARLADGTPMPHHLCTGLMTPPPDRQNSDGSGMDGGVFRFYTTQSGDIWMNGGFASAARGELGGDGGSGGEITVIATDGAVTGEVSLTANGADGDPGGYDGRVQHDGGRGGDGGTIRIAGTELVHGGFTSPELSANGGQGGWGMAGSSGHDAGYRGGDGGHGGGIRVEVETVSGSWQVEANAGDGGPGGRAEWAGEWPGGDGSRGGDGGHGGLAGGIAGIAGDARAGNGGDGGAGGAGASGQNGYPGPGGPGGDGGDGGRGGDAGGDGAQPGEPGSPGQRGSGGSGDPDGPHGQAGQPGGHGGIRPGANTAPSIPPSPSSRATYVLCVGVTQHRKEVKTAFTTYRADDDGGASAKRVQAAFARLVGVADARPKTLTYGETGNRKELEEAINEIKNSHVFKADDTFVLYIAAHGWSDLDGPEPYTHTYFYEEVPLEKKSEVINRITGQYHLKLVDYEANLMFEPVRVAVHYWVRKTGDEYLALGDTALDPDNYISDNQLASLFLDEEWRQVHKLFIIDSCRAGGFWGAAGQDLDRLSKAALIAACAESELSYSPFTYSPLQLSENVEICERVFTSALVTALEKFKYSEHITFKQLYNRIKDVGQVYEGQDGVIQDADADDPSGMVGPITFAPVSFATADFRTDLLAEGGLLHDWNGDGIVSIIGDVPPFVDCVYFQNCLDVDSVAIGDCSGDGIVSIIGDVPCFVDCLYFGNCPE